MECFGFIVFLCLTAAAGELKKYFSEFGSQRTIPIFQGAEQFNVSARDICNKLVRKMRENL